MKMNKICRDIGRRILSVLCILTVILTLLVACKRDDDGGIVFPPDSSDSEGVSESEGASDKASDDSEDESDEMIVVPTGCPVCNSTEISSTVITPAKCEETGEDKCTCASCGHEWTYRTPAKGCAIVIDAAVEENCMRSGLTQGMHCSVCGKVFVAQIMILPDTEKHKLDNNRRCTICGGDFNNSIGIWRPN